MTQGPADQTSSKPTSEHPLVVGKRRSEVYVKDWNAVEQTSPFSYSLPMAPKALIQQNPHLRNAQDYQRALRANVLSSTGIEGVRKAAERALSPAFGKTATKKR